MLLEYETERLVLKVLKPEYADMVLDFYNRDRELFERYEPDRPEGFYTRSFQATMLRAEYNLAIKKETLRFYVFLKENPDEIIGTLCFHDINFYYYKNTELGYKFSSKFHHKGYAHEALEKAIDVVFSDLGLHRIEAWILPGNDPSIKLLENLGFQYEGLCHANLLLKGEWKDHMQYSLINPLDMP